MFCLLITFIIMIIFNDYQKYAFLGFKKINKISFPQDFPTTMPFFS